MEQVSGGVRRARRGRRDHCVLGHLLHILERAKLHFVDGLSEGPVVVDMA